MSQTTKRYKANNKCAFDCFDLKSGDEYQFGCEFEFYIDTDKYEYMEVIEKIKDEIFNFSNVDVLVDINALPSDSDKNQCIQIKPDNRKQFEFRKYFNGGKCWFFINFCDG